MRELVILYARKNVEVYESLDGYVRAVSRKASPDVNLENVRTLFSCFGAFLMLVCFVSLVHHFPRKQRRTIKRKLLCISAVLVQKMNLSFLFLKANFYKIGNRFITRKLKRRRLNLIKNF